MIDGKTNRKAVRWKNSKWLKEWKDKQVEQENEIMATQKEEMMDNWRLGGQDGRVIRNEDDVIWDVFTAFVLNVRDIMIPGNLYGSTLDTCKMHAICIIAKNHVK